MPKISELTNLAEASIVASSDYLALIDSGVTYKATVQAIINASLKAPGTIGGTTPGNGNFNLLTLTGNVIQGQDAAYKTVWGSSSVPANPIRHQWFTKDATGTFYEVFALDDTSTSDGNVVAVIPKFLSIGRTGVSGTIEFGPTDGAEAIILGSGSPAFNLLYRVSKQASSGHKFGVHTTGGHVEITRTSDNHVANNEILVKLQSTNIHEFRKHSGINPTLRFVGTNGTTTEGDIWHDGNLRVKAVVGDLMLEATGNVRFGTYTALGGETVQGYITIKDEGGTTRKVAIVA